MRSLDFTACAKQDECPFECERKLTKEEKEWLANIPNRMSYADFSGNCEGLYKHIKEELKQDD